MVSRFFGSHNSDVYHWSPGLYDMFAEWLPPPITNAQHRDTYLPGYALGRWPDFGTNGFGSPINTQAINYAAYLISVGFPPPDGVTVTTEDRVVIGTALAVFPKDPRSRLYKHRLYYNTQKYNLGTVFYPPYSGSPAMSDYAEGVTTRRISPFLYDLNVLTRSYSNAQIYISVGTHNTNVASEFGFHLQAPSPYPQISDGTILEASVLGSDPITGQSLFSGVNEPQIKTLSLGYYHHNELKDDSGLIETYIEWLKEP